MSNTTTRESNYCLVCGRCWRDCPHQGAAPAEHTCQGDDARTAGQRTDGCPRCQELLRVMRENHRRVAETQALVREGLTQVRSSISSIIPGDQR